MSETCLNKENHNSSLFLLSGFLLSFSLDLLLLFWSISLFFQFFQSIHGNFSSSGDTGGEFIGSSSEGNLATFTLPNSARNSLYGSLSSSFKNVPFHMVDRHILRAVEARIF